MASSPAVHIPRPRFPRLARSLPAPSSASAPVRNTPSCSLPVVWSMGPHMMPLLRKHAEPLTGFNT